MKINEEKLGRLIQYILYKYKECDYKKLLYTLFNIDFEVYRQHGYSLSGLTYIKSNEGIECHELENFIYENPSLL